MKIKAFFLDFYGTLVHEDDDILPVIYEQIRTTAARKCSHKEIGSFWWANASAMYDKSFGELYRLQRDIGIESLERTLTHYACPLKSKDLITSQFEHWVKPVLYEDTVPFLECLRREGIRSYILSNIDTYDVQSAASYHGIEVDGIITSESVRAYKPRPEMFYQALALSGLAADEVIHIGDSLKSDIQGAQNAGIAAVWLNRLNKMRRNEVQPDYTCSNLLEVRSLFI
ncbi:haloacid dehalogenase [Paenibacillus sp. FSL H7-0326]|uniref:HAD family hydrolase n=1 Tax=Paenibacillus sp. FSL H7-0326 TaxID=1921144 RepID=UPI00096EC836|nr:HAD family hydrolase [Paenibacillus sp. FSL H7-0326]OMC71686.1 haloacid dehalogenase [Paenibacillus sp. FSL H7-0326]